MVNLTTGLLAIPEWLSSQSCMLLDLLLSVVLGFIIGLERKYRLKEAGLIPTSQSASCLQSAEWYK